MAKEKRFNFIDTIDECMTNAVKNGIFHLNTQDEFFNGREIIINDKKVINYGSCSYLGLEMDERLINGAISGAKRFGTQFSSSRLFVSCGIYEEAEDLMTQIYGLPTLIAPTTSLGHIAVLPVLVRNEDAIILDHQVHGSVRNAVEMIRPRGVRVEMIRHSNLQQLEDLIIKLRNKHDRIWYMIDGVFSMYGDYAPLQEIKALMDKYPQLYLYADDAHAMSWKGKHGRGYVLDEIPHHDRMIVATSLCKAFGAGAAALIFPNEEMKRKVRTCGSAFTYSGPVQPPMLGAIIESAKIHLTPEIDRIQKELKDKIDYAMKLIQDYKLPLVYPSDSPIQYIALGLPRTGYNLVKRMINRGFYVDIGIFPGVPIKCTGLRLAISRHHSYEDIKSVVDAIYEEMPLVLEEERQTMDEISEYFNIPFADPFKVDKAVSSYQSNGLHFFHTNSIEQINKQEWNYFLGENGSFDWDGLKFLEEAFSGNPEPENNWKFHYYIIKDNENEPILATFFTELITKDDMISPESISEQIEEKRKDDKYYLSSKVMMMGSLLTEGEHLYLNTDNPAWKEAMTLLLEDVKNEQQKCNAAGIHLRDFDKNNTQLADFFHQQGFVRVDMPDTHHIDLDNWNTEEEFISQLSKYSRRHQRRHVLPYIKYFDVEIFSDIDDKQLQHFYELYKNVKNKSFKLNTFDLPIKLFKNATDDPRWDVVVLKAQAKDSLDKKFIPVSVVINYVSENNYCPMVIGYNYDYLKTHSVYRQSLFQIMLRAKKLNKKIMHMGMEASIEKKKFGAIAHPKVVYIQANENYNAELINSIYVNKQ